jgi:D-inositol-3-phosphate glycosyltransferase
VPESYLVNQDNPSSSVVPQRGSDGTAVSPRCSLEVGLLTGGDDKTYALGLTSALVAQGIFVDFIGSNALDSPELHNTPLVNFLNLRGDQSEQASTWKKITRIVRYYARLVKYAAVAKPPIFHILWNNKFELIDRIILMVYYRLMQKKIVLTAHNVNVAKRDSRDSFVNRATLRFQYRVADHIFVHTSRMKDEVVTEFGVPVANVSVIPFGINNVYPTTAITGPEAKARLGLKATEKTALFFGQIAPYKGLEYLVSAMAQPIADGQNFRLIIAGRIKSGGAAYWENIRREIASAGLRDRIIEQVRFIPDSEVELYFKAADVLILPYTHIFQSGLPFLAYSFGLPVIATDVGSLKEDIIEGKTGLVCRPRDAVHLAESMKTYFSSRLYSELETNRHEIRAFANARYSWTKVADITQNVYRSLLAQRSR